MTPAPEFTGLGPLGQIAVTVNDMARAVAFYRDVLGLPFLFEVPGMAFFNAGGVRLLVGLPQGAPPPPNNSVLYFRVADIASAHAALAARGVKFRNAPALVARMPDHELWMAAFDDPDGNVLQIMSEVR
ncbi:MAG: VOC family protein [Candidatus Eisenbacteria bacterium]|nr:VOC family protein [Candidatus Eisenbacteria bacterium]